MAVSFVGCTVFVTSETFSLPPDTFSKLLSFGAKDNVRLVVVNRRDYAGSTKYTDEDIRDLNEGRAAFMERLGAEVAHLLIWFAETHKIPKISVDHKTGGFSIMGWSFGNATTMALLGSPEYVGKEAYRKLEPYFRQLIMYGTFSAIELLTGWSNYTYLRSSSSNIWL